MLSVRLYKERRCMRLYVVLIMDDARLLVVQVVLDPKIHRLIANTKMLNNRDLEK